VVTEVTLALEMAIAFLAEMVIGTIYVVLFQCKVAGKVAVAVIAFPVGIGIAFVLLQGLVVWEGPFTAITIRHWMVVVLCEGG